MRRRGDTGNRTEGQGEAGSNEGGMWALWGGAMRCLLTLLQTLNEGLGVWKGSNRKKWNETKML